MFVLKAMFWVSTRSHAEKPDNARGTWKHMQTRHSLCISGSMEMHESNERAMGKKRVFSHILQEFQDESDLKALRAFEIGFGSWMSLIFLLNKIEKHQRLEVLK